MSLHNINLKLLNTYIMSSFQELQVLFLLSYENGTIDNNEFLVLHEEIMPKNPDFSYEEHDRFSLEEINVPTFRPDISKPRRRRQRERHKTKGLMSRTIAVHVRYKSLYISLPSSVKRQLEMTKFCVVYGTWTTTANFSSFPFGIECRRCILSFSTFLEQLVN